jgi:Ser/Thr protein kinase RdoA (MazF antagonist)
MGDRSDALHERASAAGHGAARERAPAAAPGEPLLRALAQRLPPPVRVRARRASPYASSFPLEELDVETGTGERLALVVKELSPDALLPDARRARDGAAPDPQRELCAYDLLERTEIGAPFRYAAVREGGRTWLALERVAGERLDQCGDPDAWAATARWLAGAQARLAARADGASWLPAWQAPAAARLADAARRAPHLRPTGAPAAARQRERRLAALAEPLARARARAAALPQTVIHGELYPANVLIAGARVCALDWETIARGPALLDLAALTAGRWDEPGDPLAQAYRAALPDPPPAAELARDLDACRLLVAARWLAAPPSWTPPPEQARDWLADAERVAERLLRCAA